MSSYNLDRLGKCYLKQNDLTQAVTNFRQAFERFSQLKDSGKLGEYDLKALPEMQANLEKLEARISGG